MDAAAAAAALAVAVESLERVDALSEWLADEPKPDEADVAASEDIEWMLVPFDELQSLAASL